MLSPVIKSLSVAPILLSLMFSSAIYANDQAISSDPIKVVYQIDDASRTNLLLKNVENNLEAVPGTKIDVVAYGNGINFMLKNAKDESGVLYSVTMQKLALQHVDFKVCNNTLKSRHLTAADVAVPVEIVPSGIAEIVRLQAKEGYVYVKP